MRLAEVQRRVREVRAEAYRDDWHIMRAGLYRDTLRTLLDHDLPDDARALIEAALEAER